jgi:hypothetical protein
MTPIGLLLTRTALEVRFSEAFVYLDCCGSTMDELKLQLGDAFKGTVPGMDSAKLYNESERISVLYNWRQFVVQQDWLTAVVRVQDVAVKAWGIVNRKLRPSVTRVGMRFYFIKAADDEAHARRLVKSSGVFTIGPGWDQSELGEPHAVGGAALITLNDQSQGAYQARVALDVVQHQAISPLHDEKFREFVPKHAAQLDVDVYTNISGAFGANALKEFTKAARLWAFKISDSVSARIGA